MSVSFKSAFHSFVQPTPQNSIISINLGTNEFDSEVTLKKLAKTALSGSAMLGVSTLFNLDVVAARGEEVNEQIKYLVVVDISLQVKLFWENLEKIIRKSSDNKEALQFIISDLKENLNEYYPEKTKKEVFPQDFVVLRNTVISGRSWLSNADRFKRVKDIFDNNRFVFIHGDFCDLKVTGGIAEAMQVLSLKFDTFYFSNVRESVEKYFPEHVFSILRTSLELLKPVMTDSTNVIDTVPRPGGIKVEIARLAQRTFNNFVSTPIIDTVPYSPPCEQEWEACKKAIKAGYPKIPRSSDPHWCAIVIYNLVKFRIVNT